MCMCEMTPLKWGLMSLIGIVLLAPSLYVFIESTNRGHYNKTKIIYYTTLWTLLIGVLGPASMAAGIIGFLLLIMYLLFDVIPSKLDKINKVATSEENKKYNFYENNPPKK